MYTNLSNFMMNDIIQRVLWIKCHRSWISLIDWQHDLRFVRLQIGLNEEGN